MNNKYFYVKTNDNRALHEVRIDDVNALALFATTLNADNMVTDEPTDALVYASLLNNYFEKNDGYLKDSYRNINATGYGSEFLCSSIALFLIEKRIREKGMSDDLLKSYNREIEHYNKLLNFSKIMYDEYFDNVNKKR